MRLYHFTAKHLEAGVRAEGLTRGCIPLSIVPPSFRRGWQWLTESGEWRQSWCEKRISIPYRRDDVRFTVEIPNGEARLARWDDNRHLTPLAEILSEYGDPEHWWLFRGRIPPEWISGTAYRQEAA